MAFAYVQGAASGTSGAGGGGKVTTLGSVPTIGNLLIGSAMHSGGGTDSWPLDWTQLIPQTKRIAAETGGFSFYYKVVDNASDQTLTFLGASAVTWPNQTVLMEFSGIAGTPTVDISAEQLFVTDTTPDMPAITPTAGIEMLLLAVQTKQPATPDPGPQTITGWTAASGADTGYAFLGNRHRTNAWYRIVSSASGTYGPVTLSASSDGSEDGNIVHIAIISGPMMANFSATPLTGTRPLAVQFTDLTTKVPTSWEWDFGDSSVSTEQNPLHVYAEAGTYTVTLIAANATETDTETKVAYVVASIPTASDPTDSPTAGWWVDWGDDGFDAAGSSGDELARSLPQSTGATANDDITSKVKSVTWQRGGQADLIGGQTPGGCILTVDNQDGRFNPDNTAGLYYGLLKPGRKVWGGALRTTGTTKGLFGGYLKEVVPIPGPAKEAQLICHDVFGLWKDVRLKVGFSSNRTALEYRKDILTALGVPDAARVLAPEDAELRVSGADEKNAMSVLDRLNQATATRHVIIPADSKNDLYYYRTIGRNDNLGNAVPAATLTDLDITGMSGLRLTLDTIVNYQQVTLHPYVFDAYTRVWEYGDIPFSLSVNTTKTVTAVFGSWVKNPTVVVASSGAAVTAVAVNYGRSLAITLTAAGDANVTLLYVQGQLATELGQTTEFAEDSASQADYDTIREGGAVDVEFIAESGIARAVADAIIGRSSRPRYRPQVTMRNRFDKALTYDVGNVVLQTVDELSLTRRFEIVGCTGSVSQGGKVWDFGWTYLETPLQTTLALFTLNSSVLDGPDLLGF